MEPQVALLRVLIIGVGVPYLSWYSGESSGMLKTEDLRVQVPERPGVWFRDEGGQVG